MSRFISHLQLRPLAFSLHENVSMSLVRSSGGCGRVDRRLFPSSLLDCSTMQMRLKSSSVSSSSSSSPSSVNTVNVRLFPEELNIIYDSKCNVCDMEIKFLARRDAEKINVGRPKLKMTDIEGTNYDPLDPANGGITYQEGMAAIHAVTADGKVVKGVPVFVLAYEQVNLGWLFKVTTWPIIKHVVDIGYKLFAKYRTNITRGASMDTLVQEYEAKKALEMKMEEDECQVCKTKS